MVETESSCDGNGGTLSGLLPTEKEHISTRRSVIVIHLSRENGDSLFSLNQLVTQVNILVAPL
jgi:hypothetical protein